MPSPVAHCLVGAGVFMAVRRRRIRIADWPALAFVAAASLAPDLDVLAGLAGGETFRFHRGISHSVGAVAAAAAGLAVLARRTAVRRGAPGRWLPLWGSAFGLGGLHLAMDHLTYVREGFPALWPFWAASLPPSPVAAFFPLIAHRISDLARPGNLAVMTYELLVTGVPVLILGWLAGPRLSPSDPAAMSARGSAPRRGSDHPRLL